MKLILIKILISFNCFDKFNIKNSLLSLSNSKMSISTLTVSTGSNFDHVLRVPPIYIRFLQHIPTPIVP